MSEEKIILDTEKQIHIIQKLILRQIDITTKQTDSFFDRLFKTEDYYEKEGYTIASKEFNKVFSTLDKDFIDIKNKFEQIISKKENLINSLFDLASIFEKYQEETEIIDLCNKCTDLLKREVDDSKKIDLINEKSLATPGNNIKFDEWKW